MSSIRTTFAGAAAAVGSSVALLLGGMTPVANADPAPPPLPIDALQAPGLSAVQSIGPAIQQAAADPTNAASTLMAAAAAFAGNSAVATGLEERGDGGEPVRRARVPRLARCRVRRRICLRASTRRTPWDPCRTPRRWPPRLRWRHLWLRRRHPLRWRRPHPIRRPRRPLRPHPIRRLRRRPIPRPPRPLRLRSVPTPRRRRTSCTRRSATGA